MNTWIHYDYYRLHIGYTLVVSTCCAYWWHIGSEHVLCLLVTHWAELTWPFTGSTPDRFWPFLFVPDRSGSFWSILTVLDRSWMFLTAPDRSWPFLIVLIVPNRSWSFLTVPDCSWSYLSFRTPTIRKNLKLKFFKKYHFFLFELKIIEA